MVRGAPKAGRRHTVVVHDAMLQATGLGRRFGDLWAVRGMDLSVAAWRGPRPARSERRRARRRRSGCSPRSSRRARARRRSRASTSTTQPDAVRARIGILTETPGPVRQALGARQPRLLRPAVRPGRRPRGPSGSNATCGSSRCGSGGTTSPATFSKGMKQKLAIARALLHDPAVVFLDEPTAALDPEAAFIVREAIEGLRRAGRTIVLATHNLDEADRLCDRVAFVRGGLLRVDSPAGLRAATGVRGVDVTPRHAARRSAWRGRRRGPGRRRRDRGRAPPRGGRRGPGDGHARPRPRARAPPAPHHGGPRAGVEPRGRLLRDHGRPAGRRRRGRVMRAPHRLDHPASRVARDVPQPPAHDDDPRPAARADHRPDRPGRGHRRAVAAGRTRRHRPRPATRMVVVHAERARRCLRGPAVPRVLPA